MIGVGTFGQVASAICKKSSEKVAIKCLLLVDSYYDLKKIVREIAILQFLTIVNCPFSVKLKEIIFAESNIFLVMENIDTDLS